MVPSRFHVQPRPLAGVSMSLRTAPLVTSTILISALPKTAIDALSGDQHGAGYWRSPIPDNTREVPAANECTHSWCLPSTVTTNTILLASGEIPTTDGAAEGGAGTSTRVSGFCGLPLTSETNRTATIDAVHESFTKY